MKNEKLRVILLFVGSFTLVACGLFFNVFADVFLRALALTLIIPLILALGGGFLFLASEADKDKRVRMMIFKGVGIALSIGFLIFVIVFKTTDFYQKKLAYDAATARWCVFITTFAIILSSIGIACQVFQTVLEAVFGKEE